MKRTQIDIDAYAGDIMKALKKGVLLTTKSGDKVNSMTIEWGHLGRIWNIPVFIVYVRDSRYTKVMLEENPEFTVNMPAGDYDKKIIGICGSKSGRDCDKLKEAGLTPVEGVNISVPGLKELPLTLECRVIYKEEQDSSKLSGEIRNRFYRIEKGDHTAYYGEIVGAYIVEDE